MALVVAAGLLVSTWQRTAALDPGFRPAGVVIAETSARATGVPADRRAPLFEGARERLRGVPGVASVSAASRTPFSNLTAGVEVIGLPNARGETAMVLFSEVLDDYFSTLGARLLYGREFRPADRVGAPLVAVVGEEFAKRYFGRVDVVGERFRARMLGLPNPPYEIVGVVADLKDLSLRESDAPAIYFALNQNPAPGVLRYFAVRSRRPADALAEEVRAALGAYDARLSVAARPLQSRIDETLRLPRALALLAVFFGGLALLLAAVGLYGVVQYSVERRRTEIGVRMAIGAARGQVVAMVLGDVGRILAGGIVLGVPLSLGAAKLLSRFLFGVEPHDPRTLAFAAIVLCAAAGAAALGPARRAATIDPMKVLRQD
jgi:putative ABC transport system permease protein